jgi:prolyl oligopeptidase
MASMTRLPYPAAPTADLVDDFHGTRIADPYRPLEDADAPATRAWIAAQNTLTEQVLAAYPERQAIRERLAQVWDHPRAGVPWRRGGRWFQLRNTGLQDQDVLWTAGTPDAAATEGRVLLDPNTLGTEGTTTLAEADVSDSGELVAIATGEAGSDWRTWTVLRTATGETFPDRLVWSKFSSAAWTADDAGFFYGAYPAPAADDALEAPNRDMEIRYHRLGTDQADDALVFATPHEPEWGFQPVVADGGRLLVVSIWRGSDPETRIYVGDLRDRDAATTQIRPLLDAADARYDHVATADGLVYLSTDRDAPLGRVIAIPADAAADDATAIREIVPESGDALEFVVLVGERLACVYLHDAHHHLRIHELDGTRVADVDLPCIGMVTGLAGRREDEDLYLAVASFLSPATVLAVRMADATVHGASLPALAWDPGAYVTEQVVVTSADGTRVPLFLSHRRDVQPTGDVRTLLYGYGGFHIAIGPSFKPEWLTWMDRGGLLAVASLRGGAEYGKAWHDAGRLASKQNVFDDFAACARWLAGSGWTTSERIAVSGRSNGGLLVGATLTQHPELIGAALAEVGVLDMLRFHKFTIGWGWTSDYGCAEDPEQFPWLVAYSPLHNVRPGTAYPPTLVTTGDHDDRVVPGHSFKFAAALQAAQADEAPVLIRIDTDAGHGAGKPVGKQLDERSDVLAFLEHVLPD